MEQSWVSLPGALWKCDEEWRSLQSQTLIEWCSNAICKVLTACRTVNDIRQIAAERILEMFNFPNILNKVKVCECKNCIYLAN